MRFQGIRTSKSPHPLLKRTLWAGTVVTLSAVVLSPVVGLGLLQNTYPHVPPEVTRVPDGNQINEINARQTQQRNFEAANAERKRQIDEDSAKLLKLATDLKTELDKTNNDTLSLTVIHKADDIGKLARDLKEKMKLAVASR
jgi:hypothetical protein